MEILNNKTGAPARRLPGLFGLTKRIAGDIIYQITSWWNMIKRSYVLSLSAAAFFLASLSLPENAYAYLNPGTGSFVFQLIIATFLGGLFTVKIYWQKIMAFLKKSFRSKRVK